MAEPNKRYSFVKSHHRHTGSADFVPYRFLSYSTFQIQPPHSALPMLQTELQPRLA
ncbi:hypothetical protein HP548_05855 [Paenibacillus taichungensis]|uniref:Uncharacterized protein n=1 Tax=Paenibacillus taichungensis TaxID=484184 RepID=A0ABX2MFA4_9BACL|nr:hypothetical protein [Paenibacillus taichungensis]NUU53601.1 hypothetical protein [Paenibacillus taichungensis]